MDDQVFKLLTDRFDAQDRRLDAQNRTLAEILRQTKLTNGRVNGHDHRLGVVEEKVADAVRAERDARQEQRHRRLTKLEVAGGLFAALVCGTAGELLRALIVHHF